MRTSEVRKRPYEGPDGQPGPHSSNMDLLLLDVVSLTITTTAAAAATTTTTIVLTTITIVTTAVRIITIITTVTIVTTTNVITSISLFCPCKGPDGQPGPARGARARCRRGLSAVGARSRQDRQERRLRMGTAKRAIEPPLSESLRTLTGLSSESL